MEVFAQVPNAKAFLPTANYRLTVNIFCSMKSLT